MRAALPYHSVVHNFAQREDDLGSIIQFTISCVVVGLDLLLFEFESGKHPRPSVAVEHRCVVLQTQHIKWILQGVL